MMAHLHLTKEMHNNKQQQQQQQQQQQNNNKLGGECEKNNNGNNNEKGSNEDRNEGTPMSPPMSSLAMAFNERAKVSFLLKVF
jgi:hypothetical protein